MQHYLHLWGKGRRGGIGCLMHRWQILSHHCGVPHHANICRGGHIWRTKCVVIMIEIRQMGHIGASLFKSIGRATVSLLLLCLDNSRRSADQYISRFEKIQTRKFSTKCGAKMCRQTGRGTATFFCRRQLLLLPQRKTSRNITRLAC